MGDPLSLNLTGIDSHGIADRSCKQREATVGSSAFVVDVMVVMVVLRLLATRHATRARQRRSLAKLATHLVSPEVVEPGESALAAQFVELADHVLMLGPVRRHVSLEVRPLTVEVLAADVAVHLVAVVARRHVLVAHLLVHERLRTAEKRALEWALGVGGGVSVGRRRGRGHGRQMFLRDVPSQRGFGCEVGRVAVLPAAFHDALDQVDGL